MGKVRPGNKRNSALNGEFVTHARRFLKKSTSRLRRLVDKKEITNGIQEDNQKYTEHPEDDMN